ncbi:sugar transferase [Novosphingobium taihuense]|nr:sugar transferase [Novosphingobium taihuense]
MTLAGGAVLALAPVLLLVALLIKLEDRGPIFFVQKRTGRGNRFFPIFKFRSMRVEKLDATGNRSASKDDDRITRIGRFIRRTSIDELPQLFNVLRGEMSISWACHRPA